jgi:CMP-N-acetylneuraminic acid synthetase
VAAFQENERAFQLSVMESMAGYPQWAMTRDEEGRISPQWGYEYFIRSQDLDSLYCPSGAIWLVRSKPFRTQEAFYGDPLHGEIIGEFEGIDIDTAEHLELAAALARGYSSVRGRPVLEPISADPWTE